MNALRVIVAGAVLAWSARAFAEPACPVSVLKSKAPVIVRARDLAAARKLLWKHSTAMEHEIDVFAEPPGAGFVADVRRAYEHGGDTSYWDSSAVFVLDKSVVVARQLTKFAIVIPQECGPPLQAKILDVKIVTTPHRQLGVVRIRRDGGHATPTLPAVSTKSARPGCDKTATYRVEDHVFDLAKRREILVLAGVYQGPSYEEHAPPSPAIDAMVVTDKTLAVDAPQCKPFALRP